MYGLKEQTEKFKRVLFNFKWIDEVMKHFKIICCFLFKHRCIKWLIFITILCSSIYYIPILNWNASAVGRLVLIKWILPYYNWQHLYNARCLVDKFEAEQSVENGANNDYGGSDRDECEICESLVEIDRIFNATYGNLNTIYLSREIPVIIGDSHGAWPNSMDVDVDFIEFLQTLPNLLHSTPCNIGTNLLKIRDKRPKLKQFLNQIRKIESNADQEWFLHFRNCEFAAIKASRAIFPVKNRPYFLSTHLPPFHSSWILLSNHYDVPAEKRLLVKDLVLVYQLSGQITGRLTVQKPSCTDLCSDQKFQLNEGDTLIFNAQMWNFYYLYIQSQTKLTVTFIQEIQMD